MWVDTAMSGDYSLLSIPIDRAEAVASNGSRASDVQKKKGRSCERPFVGYDLVAAVRNVCKIVQVREVPLFRA